MRKGELERVHTKHTKKFKDWPWPFIDYTYLLTLKKNNIIQTLSNKSVGCNYLDCCESTTAAPLNVLYVKCFYLCLNVKFSLYIGM